MGDRLRERFEKREEGENGKDGKIILSIPHVVEVEKGKGK